MNHLRRTHEKENGSEHLCVRHKLTFSIKLDGVTVGLTEAPRTVEDGTCLGDVHLTRVGLGRSDHHTRTAKRDRV